MNIGSTFGKKLSLLEILHLEVAVDVSVEHLVNSRDYFFEDLVKEKMTHKFEKMADIGKIF